MMKILWGTVIAGTAAALSILSMATEASAQMPGATPQGTPAPQNTPAPPAPPAQATPVDESELILATQVAEQWLALIDQGKYAETWPVTSRFFQTNMPQDKWVQVLTSANQTLGKAVDRKLSGREGRSNIQGAPEGQYILVGYATDFERKPGLLETVTLIAEDGTWKVVGYSANPKPPAEGAQGQNPPAAETPPQPAPTPPPSR